MARYMSKQEAREAAAARENCRGPAKVPTPCATCGVVCAGARLARSHCAKPRSPQTRVPRNTRKRLGEF